jgi:predicted phosphodiesterase
MTNSFTIENTQDVVQEYNRVAGQGLAVTGCQQHIANSLGFSKDQVNRRVKFARENGLLEPNRTTPKQNINYSGPILKETQKRLEMSLSPPAESRGTYRVLAIGDAHDTPALPDKSRFRWMGKLAQDAQPEYILQIGDIADFDSLNSHVKNETLSGKQKTPFMQDIHSLREAISEFNAPINYKPQKHITLGNHENRIWRYEDYNPEVSGMMAHQLTSTLEDGGFTYSEYGTWYFVEGVGFTHAPFHGGSSPKTQSPALVSIANKLRWDAVMGHTHKKIDSQHEAYGDKPISTINLGCALPQGYIFPYAEHGLNAWWWGCSILTIHDGSISESQWFSMRTLEKHYG